MLTALQKSKGFDNLSDFCTLSDFAAVFGISKATAYRMADQGRIPCIRLGSSVTWRRQSGNSSARGRRRGSPQPRNGESASAPRASLCRRALMSWRRTGRTGISPPRRRGDSWVSPARPSPAARRSGGRRLRSKEFPRKYLPEPLSCQFPDKNVRPLPVGTVGLATNPAQTQSSF